MPNPGNRSAKIDPMDEMPPEALIEDVAPPLQEVARELRRIVRRAAPHAVERVRPRWRLIGYDVAIGRRTAFFAWVWPEQEHVHLGFPQGWAMRDPAAARMHGRGVTKRVRWLTYGSIDEVDEQVCAALLREALEIATMSRGERELRSMAEAVDAPQDAP
jgi:hypothetical protein